jgi:hypothetical protein
VIGDRVAGIKRIVLFGGKEVRKMKTLLSVIAIAVFALAFGVAYADDMPWHRPFDTGAYYGRALTEQEMGVKGAAPGGIREDVLEKSVITWDSLFGRVVIADDLPYRGILLQFETPAETKGTAPGGMRSEEHGFSIIDTLSPAGVVRDTGGLGKTQLDE